MTELDLGLKVGVRRLLWGIGYSTRLDVELRGDRRPTAASESRRGRGNRGAYETFTDLDVLGVIATPEFRISTTIADCKSGTRDKPTARMFWTRGVADLFGADHAMLVREHEVNDATRQLSSRLGITVLTAPDLLAMQGLHSIAVPAGELEVLFDREIVAAHLSAFTGLDRRLNALMEYREFDYWVYDHHRNPMQMVAHLRDAARHLDSRNPTHLALFLDMAWLYTLTLTRVLGHIQGAFLRDLDRGLQEYLFGGATNLQEKRDSATLLRSVAPPGVKDLSHLPDYYSLLRELVARLMRRPEQLQSALRYAEVASALMAARRRITLRDVLGHQFNPLPAKLLADVCGFLTTAAQLDPGFRVQARAWLLGEPASPQPAGSPPEATPAAGVVPEPSAGEAESAEGAAGEGVAEVDPINGETSVRGATSQSESASGPGNASRTGQWDQDPLPLSNVDDAG